MTQKLRRALITGAGGFIGSHLVERLVGEGFQVCAFLHYNSRGDIGLLRHIDPSLLNHVKICFGDLKDANSVFDAMKENEVVFHLGALIGIPYSYKNPRDVVDTNIVGTLNILTAAKELKVKRVLHTSTSEVYGTAQREKIDESHSLKGQSPYSASKIGADKLVESFVASYSLPVVTIRPFNTFGPRQSMRAVIPTIISQALFQKEICLGSLDPIRDFTYVEDTVDAFVSASQTEGIEGEVFNLGTDKTVSVGEIVEKVLKLIGEPNKTIRTDAQRIRPKESEVFRLCSDYSKAKECLGWAPRTSFEEGLKKTIDWIRLKREDYLASHYVV